MGGTFSEPIPNVGDVGYVAIVVLQHDKLRLLHCPQNVREMVHNTISQVCDTKQIIVSERDGETSLAYSVPLKSFEFKFQRAQQSMKLNVILRLLQEMYRLGYDFIVASEMSSLNTEYSTLFFKHSGIPEGQRVGLPLMCIAPLGKDALECLRYTDNVEKSIRNVISTSWPPGIQDEDLYQAYGEVLKTFKLKGKPWTAKNEDAYIESRFLVIQILMTFAIQQWKIQSVVNLRGCNPDIFYFTPAFTSNNNNLHEGMPATVDEFLRSGFGGSSVAILNMKKKNVLRMINFDAEVATVVRTTIARFFNEEPIQHDFSGVTEFVLKGHGFLDGGPMFVREREHEVAHRQMLCRVLESLRYNGWEVMIAARLSRRTSDKSAFIMRRCEPAWLNIACIAPSYQESNIRLIDFPENLRNQLRDVIVSCYMPGTVKEVTSGTVNSHEIKFKGTPWSTNAWNSAYNMHAKSTMLMLLKYAQETLGCELIASGDFSSKLAFEEERAYSYPAEVHTWFFSYPAGGPGMGGVNNAAGVAGMPNDHSQQSSSAVVSNSSSSRNNHYTRIRDL